MTLIVKLRGMGNEEYIRECAYCRNDGETCNVCRFRPKDMFKHKHKFTYRKILVKKNWLRRLFNKEHRTRMYKCPCGETRQEGYFIKQLPIDWEWTYI